jgi:hypothetical protein
MPEFQGESYTTGYEQREVGMVNQLDRRCYQEGPN